MSHVTLHPCWIVVRPSSLIIFHIVRAMNTVLSALYVNPLLSLSAARKYFMSAEQCELWHHSIKSLRSKGMEERVKSITWIGRRFAIQQSTPDDTRTFTGLFMTLPWSIELKATSFVKEEEKGISGYLRSSIEKRDGEGELRKTKKFPRITLREIRSLLFSIPAVLAASSLSFFISLLRS